MRLGGQNKVGATTVEKVDQESREAIMFTLSRYSAGSPQVLKTKDEREMRVRMGSPLVACGVIDKFRSF
jgi:hypothetical protein